MEPETRRTSAGSFRKFSRVVSVSTNTARKAAPFFSPHFFIFYLFFTSFSLIFPLPYLVFNFDQFY